MSVLIKGMEMPKNCDECELMTANYGCAFVGAVGGESYRKRAWDCPLVEVPTPHGDLIDKKRLDTRVLQKSIIFTFVRLPK